MRERLLLGLSYLLLTSGKNAKLPGYMDYLHLSTADVAILKGSWMVLEEHVTRVGVDFFLDLIYNHEEMKLGTVCQSTKIIVYFLLSGQIVDIGGHFKSQVLVLVKCCNGRQFSGKCPIFPCMNSKPQKISTDTGCRADVVYQVDEKLLPLSEELELVFVKCTPLLSRCF